MNCSPGIYRSCAGARSCSPACSSCSEPNYGYALLDLLEQRGFAVDANTLYPLLRRLEKQGLLTSDWNTDESRPRKFYRTSDEGDALADTLSRDWDDLDTAFRTLKGES